MIKKVLIVEDDALLSIVQKRLIERMGHKVLASVDNGRAAIEKVKTISPDIILMDMSLHGDMNGIETMQEIRKTSSIPVIYLSGSTAPQNTPHVRAINPVGYLTKPVKKHELELSFKKAFLNAG